MGRTTEWDGKNFVNVNLLWMKRDDKREDFKFEVFKGFWNGKEVIASGVRRIEWKLTKVVAGWYDYTDDHGATKHAKTLTFFLDDDEHIMKYWTWYNIVSRNIIFALASIEWEIWMISMAPYWSKTWYRNMWITNNGQDVMSTFDYEKDIKSKMKYSEEFQKTSYVELDKWIEEELVPQINSKISASNKSIEDFIKEDESSISLSNKKTEVDDEIPF